MLDSAAPIISIVLIVLLLLCLFVSFCILNVKKKRDQRLFSVSQLIFFSFFRISHTSSLKTEFSLHTTTTTTTKNKNKNTHDDDGVRLPFPGTRRKETKTLRSHRFACDKKKYKLCGYFLPRVTRTLLEICRNVFPVGERKLQHRLGFVRSHRTRQIGQLL